MRIIGSGLFPDPRIIYDLSPAETQAACDGYEKQQRRHTEAQKVYCGMICAAIYNTAPGKKTKKQLAWTDFFAPGPSSPGELVQDTYTMQQTAMRVTRMFGGTVHGERN